MRLHEFSYGFSMSPTDDDVVVANGMLEQIRLQVDVERDLCATKMVTVRRFDGLCLNDKISVQLGTSPFK